MAFQDPIAGIIGMFGDTNYRTLYSDNEALRPALTDAVRQLASDRSADQRSIAQIEGEVNKAQGLYDQITPEDLAVLGRIARTASVNPLDTFDALSSRYTSLANQFADRLGGGALSAVDKLGLSRAGYGGRGGGRSRYETILATNRSNQAALPLFQTALSSISPATSAIGNTSAQQANTAMDAIAARGNLPLRGWGLGSCRCRRVARRPPGTRISSGRSPRRTTRTSWVTRPRTTGPRNFPISATSRPARSWISRRAPGRC